MVDLVNAYWIDSIQLLHVYPGSCVRKRNWQFRSIRKWGVSSTNNYECNNAVVYAFQTGN